jgi:hypothetical protein
MLEDTFIYKKIQLELADVIKHRDKLIEEIEKLETTLIVLDRYKDEFEKFCVEKRKGMKMLEDTSIYKKIQLKNKPQGPKKLTIPDHITNVLKSKNEPQSAGQILKLVPNTISRGSLSSVLSQMKYMKMVKHDKNLGLWFL